jgi:diacylglycerol kinase family enzyme
VPSPESRAAALACLLIVFATLALGLDIVIEQFPRGLIVLGCIGLSLIAAWYGARRRGIPRLLGLGFAGVALAGAAILLIARGDHFVQATAVVAGVLLTSATARIAFRRRAPLTPARRPEHPVLFYNPKSGGGKAERFSLADEARVRGITPIELTTGDDLEQLVRGAVDDGADALAMAGGDGSQAVVAEVAAKLDLPYACIPAGTRNHFALDLGVDRDDVVGALDAFVDGGERRVDLAEVNGRVFVNKRLAGPLRGRGAAPGLPGRQAPDPARTVPDVLGPDGEGLDLAWRGPGGHEHHSGVAVLVSNNRYRLGRPIGSGTRPRIDDGQLGVTVLSSPTSHIGRAIQHPWREWSAPDFEVDSDHPVPAGIDGEAVTLEPPLRFRVRPGVLRVRIAKAHPGASPSAVLPEEPWEGIRALARIASGRLP